MRIWVKGFQRNRFPLDVTDFNVSVLKGKIAQESGIPANEQHIVFRGEILKDDDSLKGVEENDQITLLKKINDNVLPKVQPPPVTPISSGVLPNGQPAAGQPLPPDLQNMVNNLMNNFMRGRQQMQQQPQQQQQQQQQPQAQQIPQFLFGPPPAGQPPQTEQRPIPQAATIQRPAITVNSLPPISQDLLDQLVGMGFPAFRARKALFFNKMDVERSVEWLFEHMDDADIDSPLTRDQIALISRLYNLQSPQASPQPSPQPSPQAIHTRSPASIVSPAPSPPASSPSSSSNSIPPSSSSSAQDPEKAKRQQAVQECVSSNVCTNRFNATGRQFTQQEFYQCFTCNLAGNQGCCAVCARVCHAGHNLSAPSTTTFFCDCGAGESGKACTALTKKQ